MTKINKAQARKLHAQHKPYIIVPCKCNPNSMFAVTVKPGWTVQTFENFYNQFCYYNCNNEVGKYPHFYIDD